MRRLLDNNAIVGGVPAKVLFPYHYSDTDLSYIPAALAEDSIDVRIRHYE